MSNEQEMERIGRICDDLLDGKIIGTRDSMVPPGPTCESFLAPVDHQQKVIVELIKDLAFAIMTS